jgi:hypothetical protein
MLEQQQSFEIGGSFHPGKSAKYLQFFILLIFNSDMGIRHQLNDL